MYTVLCNTLSSSLGLLLAYSDPADSEILLSWAPHDQWRGEIFSAAGSKWAREFLGHRHDQVTTMGMSKHDLPQYSSIPSLTWVCEYYRLFFMLVAQIEIINKVVASKNLVN